jgi:hypothetical protein
MVHIIIKKSERELRERAHESAGPGYKQGKTIDGYARGMEEADRLVRDRGRDNPNQKPVLVDDGGQAERKLKEMTLKAHGKNPEGYDQ